MKDVIVYSKTYCPYCVRAKELLNSKGIKFTEINIEEKPEERDIMIEKSNGRKTVPQIFIGDFHVGGCDDLFALDGKGELDNLFETETDEGENHHSIAIIGSGPAGYTAGIYAARAGLSPIIFTGMAKGGQLTTTTEVDNFPGFKDGIDGTTLMLQMEAQCKRFGTEVQFGRVSKVELEKRPFKLHVGNEIHTTDALIIATGANARYLGLPSEQKYLGRGVSGCATCDGFFFRGETVAIVGGGDTAMEEATYLSNICEKVYLIHRRDTFKASKAMQEKVFKNEKIEILYNSTVDEVLGDEEKVTGLSIKNTVDSSISTIDVGGVFIAIGHVPATDFLEGQLPMDGNGFLLKEEGSKTVIPGVFVAGDVADPHYRQAITSAGSGCIAALDAERFLESQK